MIDNIFLRVDPKVMSYNDRTTHGISKKWLSKFEESHYSYLVLLFKFV